MKFHCVALAALACALASPAFAQTSHPDAPSTTARFHVGRLAVNPTLALTNLGVDDNVFNASDPSQRKADFTMTVTPRADLWMPLGRAWFGAELREDLVYFQEYSSERSANGSSSATLLLPLSRFTVKVGGDFLNTRERPGFDIDARSQRQEAGYQAALEWHAFSKTSVALTYRRVTVAFDQSAVFAGANLQQELNRTMTTAGVVVKHRLTAVTSLTADVERETDAFQYSSVRDSRSTRASAGIRFDSIINGSMNIGVRRFRPDSPDVPAFDGAIASVDVSFAPLQSTRFGVHAMRDLQYSYDFQQPYYLGTGGSFSVTQGLFGPFDAQARVGLQTLAYQGRLGTAALGNRTDNVFWFGGGLGYRVRKDVRMGFNLDKQHRSSDRQGFGYDGLRFGTSVTYGF